MSTSWVRQLGGAGDEYVAAIATGVADGSTTLLTVVGAKPADRVTPELLGVVRLDASGKDVVSEAHLQNPGRAEWSHLSLAVTPQRGTVFVAGTCSGDCPDLGKGKANGNVLLKLDADDPTEVAWQQALPHGTLTSNVAVDDAGSAVVAVGPLVTKYSWDQRKLWEKNAKGKVRAIAVDANRDVVVACDGLVVEKHAADDGRALWTRSLSLAEGAGGSFSQVGVTAIGTVVLAGSFHGTVSFGGGDPVSTPTDGDLLAVAEADGSPRFLAGIAGDENPLIGMAVDPAGSAVVLTSGGPERCGERVTKHALDAPGSVAWGPLRLASCDPATSDLVFGGGAHGLEPGPLVAVDPSSHDVRIGGGLQGVVDLGAASITSRGGVDGVLVDLEP